MASAIDVTFPADNVKVDKALERANWKAASDEITQLQREVGLPWQIAFGIISF